MHRTAHTLRSKTAPYQRAHPVSSGRVRPILLRCGLALLLVAAAAAISYPLRGQIYTTPLFFVAVVLSCWYGGTVPGVLAAIASTALIHFLIHQPRGQFTPNLNDLPRLTEFVFVAAIAIYLVATRKRVERSLREARDQLEMKVFERTADLKKANEALYASEQLARSHVELMMRSLDVLATEATPEKFIGEILRTIGQHLNARSVMLWLRSNEDDSLRLRVAIEGEQQIAPDPEHPFVKDPQGWKTSPLTQEMLFTKGPVVCDDIEHDQRIGPDFREYLVNKGRKKFMAIPMFVLGEVRGFIGIQHVEREAYRAEEIELAQALAHHVMNFPCSVALKIGSPV